MSLSLINIQPYKFKDEKMKEKFRDPARNIHHCPACKSKELLRLNVDLICLDCDWDSIEAYVWAGGMDNLNQAFKDNFGRKLKRIVSTDPVSESTSPSNSKEKIEVTA